jgi:hypothetical protein
MREQADAEPAAKPGDGLEFGRIGFGCVAQHDPDPDRTSFDLPFQPVQYLGDGSAIGRQAPSAAVHPDGEVEDAGIVSLQPVQDAHPRPRPRGREAVVDGPPLLRGLMGRSSHVAHPSLELERRGHAVLDLEAHGGHVLGMVV